MKNADHLLHRIMKEVDTNRDGKIQYEGMLGFFSPFVASAPRTRWVQVP